MDLREKVRLAYGDNIFKIKVTAEKGNSEEYILRVYRKPLDAELKLLLVNDIPAASAGNGKYIAYVPTGSTAAVKAKGKDSRAITRIDAGVAS